LLPRCADAATVSPAVAKLLLPAESALNSHNYAAALAAVNRAAALPTLSAYDQLVIAQLRGAAAAGAGQYALAAQSYATVLAGGQIPAAERLPITQAVASYYASAGDNAQTVVWVDRYVAAGGTDTATRALAAQADYATGNYAAVARDVRRDGVDALPAELQIAVAAGQKSGDAQAYFDALQALLKTSPSPAYWNEAIALVQAQPGFPDALMIDIYRLRLATNTIKEPGDFEDYAERAILAGHPLEAERELNAGFAAGTLTPQTDGGHAESLRGLAAKTNPPPAPFSPLTPLDIAIASGHGFTAVPGYAQDAVGDAQAALARLWVIHAAAQS
jgi:hypothetical protein